MKRLCRRILVSAVVVLVSCARREPPAARPSVLVRHLLGDPPSLDPTVTSEESGLVIEELMFRPLVNIDAARRPLPGLAASWTVSPDGLVYEFHLDPTATWDDGSGAITSDDVRFTVERVRDPKVNGANWGAGFQDLAAVETPDPLTVRFRFTHPYAERMIAFTLPIVSAAAYAKAKAADVGRHPVGSGPYKFVSWESNQKVRLARRPDVKDAAFDEILFRIIPDPAVRYQAGARGELDEFRLTRDQNRTASASPEFLATHRIVRAPQFLVVMVVWDCKSPLLADTRTRRALALALPRSDLAKSLYPPDGANLVSGPYPARVPENAPDVTPMRYDPAESGRLLDAAGWKAGPDGARRKGGRKATIDWLTVAGQPIYENITEVARQAYEKVGVQLVARPLDWAAYTERGDRGEFDALLIGRLFQPPNFDPFQYYHSSQWAPKGLNNGFYSNKDADAAMEAARLEQDPVKRIELFRATHRILAADPPGDFLWGADQPWAVSKRLTGVEVSDFGLFHFRPGALGWRLAAPGEKVAAAHP